MKTASLPALILVVLFIAASNAGGDGAAISKATRDRIDRDRPEGVVIKSVGGSESAITVRGDAQTVIAVANFVENIKADPRFTAPEMNFVREKPNSSPKRYEYEFRFAVASR